MKELFRKIRLFFSRILTGILFVTAIVAVYYLFPRQGTFPFEFQKGSPWKHETLIANVDFPILKSSAEILQERDSVMGQLKPYFVLDDGMGQEKIREFKSNFPIIWDQFVGRHSLDTLLTDSIINNLEVVYTLQVGVMLDTLYHKGILPDLSGVDLLASIDNGLIVTRDKIVSERLPDEVAGTIGSYHWLNEQMSDSLILYGLDPAMKEMLFSEVGYNRFIVPNLSYDQMTTTAVQKSLLDEISETRGLVQEGQRIIGRGELISEDTYQILVSFQSSFEKLTGDSTTIWLIRSGQVLLILITFMALFFFLRQFRAEILQHNLKLTFVLIMMLLAVLAASIGGQSDVISIYLIPFIIVPVVMRAFFDARLALFIHLITMMLVGFLVPNGFEFIFIQIIAGFAAIVSFSHLHRRGQLVVTAVIIFLVSSLLVLALELMHEGSFTAIEWITFAWLAANAVLVLFSYPLIYIFEKLFGFISDVTLIELSDSNHPLLRKLAEDAPGTFQHSMQVANLAESVVRIIGGNPLLVRAGAMYHDIGKSEGALYYTENQVGNVNPHDSMNRVESARIIVNHVIRGAEIARKHKLPKPVADFILTHHGTSKVQYFLKMQQKENQEDSIDLADFSYPGPRPYSKEAAVMMMADSIEAASRSLDDYAEDAIKDLIDQIVNYQLSEGQFEEAEITFKEMNRAKEIFLSKLVNIYHGRIKYPK